MKKLLLSAAMVAFAITANADQTVYFSEDFEWIKPWAQAGKNGNGKPAAGNTIESNGAVDEAPQLSACKVDGVSLYDAMKEKGYEFLATFSPVDKSGNPLTERTPDKQIYVQDSYLKFGLTNYFSGIVFPTMADLGEGTTNVKMAFDWCPMKQSSGVWDTTILVIVVKNGDGPELQFPVMPLNIADGADFKWYRAVVPLTDATITKDTRISIRNIDPQWPGNAQEAKSNLTWRYFLDNIKVYSGDDDPVVEPEPEPEPEPTPGLEGAKKVAFVAANAEEFYDGDAETIVIMPNGFYFDTTNDRAPKAAVKKGIASDCIFMESTTEITGSDVAGKANKSYVTSGGLRWYTNQGIKFTPATGITIKGVKVRTQSLTKATTPNNYVWPITPEAKDSKFDVTDPEKLYISASFDTAEPIGLKAWGGQIRAFYIEVYYDGTSTQVAVPTCSAVLPGVASDEEITLACSTEGAEIYYTLDGSVPTTASTKYTAPFKLSADAIIRAIAVKGESTSFPFFGEYFCVAPGTNVATFNLSDWASLTKNDGTKFTEADYVKAKETDTPPCNMYIPMDGTTLYDNGVSIAFGGKEAQIFKSWTFGNTVEYRPNNDGVEKVSVPEGCSITNVIISGSNIAEDGKSLTVEGNGTGDFSPVNYSNYMWKAGDATESINNVSISKGVYIDQVYVYYTGTVPTGVAEIATDENAPVEYYNLQGLRVANPSNGLYIVKQGNKVSKRIIK